jgi:hypothetical protein
VCELLKTVSLLKSDTTNEKTKHKKLITTKKNCKNVNDKILVSNTLDFLKFFAERKKRTNPKKSPKRSE